jgi:hypothetical protein
MLDSGLAFGLALDLASASDALSYFAQVNRVSRPRHFSCSPPSPPIFNKSVISNVHRVLHIKIDTVQSSSRYSHHIVT